jgi:hypothetical protein
VNSRCLLWQNRPRDWARPVRGLKNNALTAVVDDCVHSYFESSADGDIDHYAFARKSSADGVEEGSPLQFKAIPVKLLMTHKEDCVFLTAKMVNLSSVIWISGVPEKCRVNLMYASL